MYDSPPELMKSKRKALQKYIPMDSDTCKHEGCAYSGGL